METQQIYDYVQAMKYQAECEDIVNVALQQLNPDNQVIGTARPLQAAYSKLVQELVTPQQWDWLDWWMWETDFGQRSAAFGVNNEMVDVQGMSFFKFWEIINNA
jgi:ABC-type uncharacterized transport system permease subunit